MKKQHKSQFKEPFTCFGCVHHHVCTFKRAFDRNSKMFDFDRVDSMQLMLTLLGAAAEWCDHFKIKD